MLDVLEKVLEMIYYLWEGKGRIIMVVGCGGDWDKVKCLKMVIIVVCLSDIVIFIFDNLCMEEFMLIIKDMVDGLLVDLEWKLM